MNAPQMRGSIAAKAIALLLAGCGSATQPLSAVEPLPANAIRPLGFSFRLVDDPQNGTKTPANYKVTYLSGTITVRDKPLVLIGFRVDPAHPDGASELLKSNIDAAKAKGFPIAPTSAGGGTGLSYIDSGTGKVNQYRSIVAKGAVTVTINIDSDPADGGDSSAKTLHDTLLESLTFRPSALGGSWPGAALVPQVPVSVNIPREIAKDSYSSTLGSYYLELGWGDHTSKLGVTWQDKTAAAKEFASIRADLDAAGVKHQSDVRTLPALRDSLGAKVDEGFSFNLVGADKLPRFVGVVWRKGGVIVRSISNVGDIPISSFDDDAMAALGTPMGIAKSWAWLP